MKNKVYAIGCWRERSFDGQMLESTLLIVDNALIELLSCDDLNTFFLSFIRSLESLKEWVILQICCFGLIIINWCYPQGDAHPKLCGKLLKRLSCSIYICGPNRKLLVRRARAHDRFKKSKSDNRMWSNYEAQVDKHDGLG